MSKEHLDDAGTPVTEKAKPKLEKPPLYKVVFHNDDYTTMDFVIDVLMKYFGHNDENASLIMYDVHRKGKGIAGVYPKDVAETKATATTAEARKAEFPLLITIEADK